MLRWTRCPALGAKRRALWGDVFYQLANRLAHLYFLRKGGERAWLALVNFLGDDEMGGPNTKAEWEAAYQVAYVLAFEAPLASRYIIHAYMDPAR